MAEKPVQQYKNEWGEDVKIYVRNGERIIEVNGNPILKQYQKSNSSNQPKAKKEKKSEKSNLGGAYGDRVRGLQNRSQPPAGIESYGDRIKRLQDRNKPTTPKQTPTQKFIQQQQKNKPTAMTNNLKPTPLQALQQTQKTQQTQQKSTNSDKITFPSVKKASAPASNTNKSSAVSNNLKSTPSKTTAKPKATTTKVVVTLPDGVKTTGYINPKDNRTYYDKDFTKPLKTQGAKVTKIKGNKKDEYIRYKKFEELS